MNAAYSKRTRVYCVVSCIIRSRVSDNTLSGGKYKSSRDEQKKIKNKRKMKKKKRVVDSFTWTVWVRTSRKIWARTCSSKALCPASSALPSRSLSNATRRTCATRCAAETIWGLKTVPTAWSTPLPPTRSSVPGKKKNKAHKYARRTKRHVILFIFYTSGVPLLFVTRAKRIIRSKYTSVDILYGTAPNNRSYDTARFRLMCTCYYVSEMDT